jgi:hypothetical protein
VSIVEEALVNTFDAKPIDPSGPLPWEND